MKLQEQLSRKVGSKRYSKFVITIPPKEIEKLGWKSGNELNFLITDKKLILKKK